MLPTVFRDMQAGDFAFCLRVLMADDDALASRLRHAKYVQGVVDLGDS